MSNLLDLGLQLLPWLLAAGALVALVIVWLRHRRKVKKESVVATDLAGESGIDNRSDRLTMAARGQVRPCNQILAGYQIPPGKESVNIRNAKLVHVGRDSPIMVLGGTGSGKTAAVVMPTILEWLWGPVVATSVKTDIAEASYKARKLLGNVFVFDPAGEIVGRKHKKHLEPYVAKWTPLVEADTFESACSAAEALIAGAEKGDDQKDAFWTGQASDALGVLLWLARRKPGTTMAHVTAQLGKLTATFEEEVPDGVDKDGNEKTKKVKKTGWEKVHDQILAMQSVLSTEVKSRKQAVEASPEDEEAQAAFAKYEAKLEEVEAVERSWSPFVGVARDAPQTMAGVSVQLKLSLRWVESAKVLKKVAWDDPDLLNLDDFVVSKGDTLYIISDLKMSKYAPILTVFTQSVIEAGLRQAQERPSERLPHQMLAALDELPNIAPLPMMATYASTVRSFGIQLLMVAQDHDQLYQRWGENIGNSIVSNATSAKFCLPKGGSLKTLNYFKDLFGQARIAERSITKGTSTSQTWGGGSEKTSRTSGESESETISYTWRPVADVGQLSSMHEREMAVLIETSRAQLVQRRWYEDKDLAAFADGDAEAYQRVRARFASSEDDDSALDDAAETGTVEDKDAVT